ncbi:uncharacterized protein ACOB8E_022475 isoform 1-T4 [Sarcophilus harrisii]
MKNFPHFCKSVTATMVKLGKTAKNQVEPKKMALLPKKKTVRIKDILEDEKESSEEEIEVPQKKGKKTGYPSTEVSISQKSCCCQYTCQESSHETNVGGDLGKLGHNIVGGIVNGSNHSGERFGIIPKGLSNCAYPLTQQCYYWAYIPKKS